MNRFFSCAALAALWFSGNATCVAAEVQADVSPQTVREDVFPKTEARFAAGVVGYPDIEYSNLVGFRPLLLDLYRLEHPAAKAQPLVIWVHGGGWNRGDSRTGSAYTNFPAVLASLAARGYVVTSVNYRLSAEAPFPAQIQDVKAAIRYLRANAQHYGIDPAKIIVWGGSAGGHLAALAATSCGVAKFDPAPSTGRLSHAQMEKATAPAVSDCVQGAVIWFGPLDLTTMTAEQKPGTPAPGAQKEVLELLRCKIEDCAAQEAAASPVSYVSASSPPMLLIHGIADKTVPVSQSEEMAEHLHKAGVPVETLYIPDADHGWIGPTLEITRSASLLALRRSFEFIDKIAGAK